MSARNGRGFIPIHKKPTRACDLGVLPILELHLEWRVIPELDIFCRLDIVVAVDQECWFASGMKPVCVDNWLVGFCFGWEDPHILHRMDAVSIPKIMISTWSCHHAVEQVYNSTAKVEGHLQTCFDCPFLQPLSSFQAGF